MASTAVRTSPPPYRLVFHDRPSAKPKGRAKAARAMQPSENLIQLPSVPTDIEREAAAYVEAATVQLRAKSVAYLQLGDESRQAYRYLNLFAVGPVALGLPVIPLEEDQEEEPRLDLPVTLYAGDWAMICALAWSNPRPGADGGLPATTILGERPWRMQFATLNRSAFTPGEGKAFTGNFPVTAPDVLVQTWLFRAPDPGPVPAMFEANATFTVRVGDRMLGRFAHWHNGEEELTSNGLAPFQDEAVAEDRSSVRYLVVRRPKASKRPQNLPERGRGR